MTTTQAEEIDIAVGSALELEAEALVIARRNARNARVEVKNIKAALRKAEKRQRDADAAVLDATANLRGMIDEA